MPSNTRRNQWSWALYDWANSAFTTSIMAGFFPLFFKQFWSVDTSVTESTFWLGLGNSAASLLVVFLAPLLGALADVRGNYRRPLFAFVLLGVFTTGGLYLVEAGNWPLAIILYILATIGFSAANVYYDAMLPGISSPQERHRVSALGFSLGYLGGGILLAVNVAMSLRPDWFGLPDATTAVRFVFISVAIWWGLFTLPLMFAPMPHNLPKASGTATFRASLVQLRDTLRSLRTHRPLMLFLLAYWLYIDGVDTIIRMAVDFGTAIGLPANSLITALLLVQFIGFPATLAFGRIAERIGARRGLWIGLWIYVLITLAATFMSTSLHFYLLAICLGLVQGGVQALSRSLFSQLIPPGRDGEYFGLFNMLGKAAAVLGPVLVGITAAVSGNSRLGLLSIIILFLAGMWFLRLVDDPELSEKAS